MKNNFRIGFVFLILVILNVSIVLAGEHDLDPTGGGSKCPEKCHDSNSPEDVPEGNSPDGGSASWGECSGKEWDPVKCEWVGEQVYSYLICEHFSGEQETCRVYRECTEPASCCEWSCGEWGECVLGNFNNADGSTFTASVKKRQCTLVSVCPGRECPVPDLVAPCEGGGCDCNYETETGDCQEVDDVNGDGRPDGHDSDGDGMPDSGQAPRNEDGNRVDEDGNEMTNDAGEPIPAPDSAEAPFNENGQPTSFNFDRDGEAIGDDNPFNLDANGNVISRGDGYTERPRGQGSNRLSLSGIITGLSRGRLSYNDNGELVNQAGTVQVDVNGEPITESTNPNNFADYDSNAEMWIGEYEGETVLVDVHGNIYRDSYEMETQQVGDTETVNPSSSGYENLDNIAQEEVSNGGTREEINERIAQRYQDELRRDDPDATVTVNEDGNLEINRFNTKPTGFEQLTNEDGEPLVMGTGEDGNGIVEGSVVAYATDNEGNILHAEGSSNTGYSIPISEDGKALFADPESETGYSDRDGNPGNPRSGIPAQFQLVSTIPNPEGCEEGTCPSDSEWVPCSYCPDGEGGGSWGPQGSFSEGCGGSGGGGGSGQAGIGDSEMSPELDMVVTQDCEILDLSLKDQQDVITFEIDGEIDSESHSLELISRSSGRAVVQISSDPFNVTLILNEPKTVDVDNDGTDDMMLELRNEGIRINLINSRVDISSFDVKKGNLEQPAFFSPISLKSFSLAVIIMLVLISFFAISHFRHKFKMPHMNIRLSHRKRRLVDEMKKDIKELRESLNDLEEEFPK